MASIKQKAVCFIFARGGSKGLPGKNIKPLAGKPLIAHSIAIARQCARVETVVVSTDDAAIAEVARIYGAEVPFMRPAELSSDTAPEWLAWRHAVDWYQRERGSFDIFLSLPATSPFRSLEDVNACLDLLASDREADAVITVREAERSPYFNMVSLDKDGYANLVIRPKTSISRRQDAPRVYEMTTVAYAVRPAFINRADCLFAGRLRAVCVPVERAMDIDTPYDFMLAEALAASKFSHILG
ncbi:N-acylneuraminate cytidylyltransferase [Sulfuritortus calidifontis]|uniref:N-acylneuraminate cytidylyltransferase n=1 Tax=Sulfuritortus calidifontis TaxID=1914471 RepID=A0A4R3JZE4_9PROT|nr:acylneuraminate cytidylyltransferase family protein [Sulfuritortus calidifontis]TCS72477.1 N-acylneuraminate cytidylyltransferase [Sulfuritortus calidifontis]